MEFRKLFRRHLLAGLFVVTPTVLAALHFGLLASDVYVSEARFVVRAPDQANALNGLGVLFKSFTTAGSEEIMFVRDYLLSREVIGQLDDRLGLRAAYAKADLLNRFPAFGQRNTLEAFYGYYGKMVKIEVDPQSSVAVLTVEGFSPEAVNMLNQALLDAAARRIDALNSQIRSDTLDIAQHELDRAGQRLTSAESALAAFRVANGVVDPERQAGLELQSAQELELKRVAASARLKQVLSIAPRSPQVPVLQTEVQALETASRQIQSTVTGAAKRSRTMTTQQFQGLAVERDIAVKIVAAASEALVRARVEVERKHLYLETVSSPTLPDDALYPKRLRGVLATLLLSTLVYGIVGMLLTGVREHQSAR